MTTAAKRREDALDRWIFAAVDTRIAALARIGLCLLLAVVFWPEDRILTNWIADSALGPLYPELFRTRGWWLATLAVLGIWGAGARPRWIGFVLVALLLPQAFLEGATRSRQILLVALFCFSLLRGDLVWRVLSRRSHALDAGPIWPIRLVQIQLSATYLVNAVAKTTREYLSGDALVAMSSHHANFLVDLGDGALHVGPLAIPVWICAVGTVAVEYTLAVGFWLPRLRWAVTLLGVGFHAALLQVIAIGWLHVASIALYPAFLLPFAGRAIKGPGGRDASLGN